MDVVVVGGGNAGCYFAWQVAREGYSVLVLEAGDLATRGAHIEILHMNKLARVGAALVRGVLTKRFSRTSFSRFLAASGRAGRIKEHYRRYPGTPAGLEAWVSEAAQLWGERKITTGDSAGTGGATPGRPPADRS
ncbi:MAG TPA: FAD-dependent oxidoreductase [Spirochaetia bacterium]